MDTFAHSGPDSQRVANITINCAICQGPIHKRYCANDITIQKNPKGFEAECNLPFFVSDNKLTGVMLRIWRC